MNYHSDIQSLANLGATKAKQLKSRPLSGFIGAMQAGAYVGIAIILIMTLGAKAPESLRPLVMGGAFGLALILVVIAGAELFTGYNLYTTLAVAQNRLSPSHAIITNTQIFVGNLVGCLLLATIYRFGSGSLTSGEAAIFLQSVAAKKMHLSGVELVARGILCNWLVCLALWMARRVDSDAARCIVIGWCLLAFIASGFEHSVANMTVHLLALFGPPNADIHPGGAVHNLCWVTLGNVIGGGLFVGIAYHLQAKPVEDTATDARS